MRALEEPLLLALNGLHAPWLDGLAELLSEWALFAYPLVLLVALALRRRGIAATVRDGWLAWLLALFVAESVLKPLVARPRPTAIPELLEQLHVLGRVPPATSLSFPSGTAAACAAGAVWLWLRLGPRAGIPGALLALSTCVARVYAGVHWPSDIVAGAVVGGLVSWGVDRFTRWASR